MIRSLVWSLRIHTVPNKSARLVRSSGFVSWKDCMSLISKSPRLTSHRIIIMSPNPTVSLINKALALTSYRTSTRVLLKDSKLQIYKRNTECLLNAQIGKQVCTAPESCWRESPRASLLARIYEAQAIYRLEQPLIHQPLRSESPKPANIWCGLLLSL